MSVKRTVVPCLNCTDEIVPSGSIASAASDIVAGAMKAAPFVGEIRAIVGDWLLLVV